MIKIIPIGGTARAVPTLKSLFSRNDVKIPLVIIMRGYAEDLNSANELLNITLNNSAEYIVVDGISDELQLRVQQLDASAFIGIGVWRPLLTLEFLSSTKYGFLAVHGTPLPRYRGWAGVAWQIINGDKEINLQAYKLSLGIDDGPLISRPNGTLVSSQFELGPVMHLKEVFIEYERHHLILVNEIIDLVISGNIQFIEQDNKEATFACHRGPGDGEINWNDNSENVFNFIRGQSPPYPCAYTYYRGSKIYIERVKLLDNIYYEGRIPGKVVERNKSTGTVLVLTRDGIIEILEVRTNDGKVEPYKTFTSIRERCKTRLEAFMDKFYPDF
jgi:methionyl-tRNA formyltransferase